MDTRRRCCRLQRTPIRPLDLTSICGTASAKLKLIWMASGVKSRRHPFSLSNPMLKTLKFSLALAVIVAALAGRNASTPQASEEQKKDFKGGPMPADARAKFEAAQKESQAAIAKKAADAAGGTHTT